MKKNIYIGIFILVVFLFRLNKNKNNPEKVFEMLKNQGVDRILLRYAEKIYRLETNHFKSNIYKHTFGAGAIAAKKSYPYGFSFLKKVKTNGLYHSKNGYNYIKFNTLLDGVVFLLIYLSRGNLFERIQRWGGAPGYLERVLKVENKFIKS